MKERKTCVTVGNYPRDCVIVASRETVASVNVMSITMPCSNSRSFPASPWTLAGPSTWSKQVRDLQYITRLRKYCMPVTQGPVVVRPYVWTLDVDWFTIPFCAHTEETPQEKGKNRLLAARIFLRLSRRYSKLRVEQSFPLLHITTSRRIQDLGTQLNS